MRTLEISTMWMPRSKKLVGPSSSPCTSLNCSSEATTTTSRCENGGRWTAKGNCECPQSFYGVYCEKHCKDGLFDKASQKCICKDGYGAPPNCTLSIHCRNNGTLSLTENKCICPPDTYGDTCEHRAGPCIRGTWKQETHICACDRGYEGYSCSVSSCQHGGIPTGTGDCSCPVFFGGSSCENDHRLYLIIPLVIALLILSQYVQRKCRKKPANSHERGYLESLRAFNRDFGHSAAASRLGSATVVVDDSRIDDDMRTLNKAWRETHCRLESIPECDEFSSRRSTATEADIRRSAKRIQVNVDVVQLLAQSQSSLSDTDVSNANEDCNGELPTDRISLVRQKLQIPGRQQNVAPELHIQPSTESLPEDVLSHRDNEGNGPFWTPRELESASSEPFITSRLDYPQLHQPTTPSLTDQSPH